MRVTTADQAVFFIFFFFFSIDKEFTLQIQGRYHVLAAKGTFYKGQ